MCMQRQAKARDEAAEFLRIFHTWMLLVKFLSLRRFEENNDANFALYFLCAKTTHCVEVPDPLEGEPLPQAHPALLSEEEETR